MHKRPNSSFKKYTEVFRNINALLVMKLHQLIAPEIGESTRMGRNFQSRVAFLIHYICIYLYSEKADA